MSQKKIKMTLKTSTKKKKVAMKPMMRAVSAKSLSSKRRPASNKPRKIRGKGDYLTDAFNFFDKDAPASEGFVNNAAKTGGEWLGNKIGLGRQVGNAASKLARIFGFGDYTINHKYNINKNSFTGSSPPTFSGSTGEDIIVTRREYVQDLTGTTDFSARKFFLNPGNPLLFPWLSSIAKNYEEYSILGMVFEFKTDASDAISTGGGLGTVVIATDYDCLDDNFTTKRTMQASEFSNSSIPSKSFLHPIECDPRRNVLSKMYVLPDVTDVSQIANGSGIIGDPRFDCIGQTYVATQGLPHEDGVAASTIGELWISYKIRLSRPILETNSASSALLQTIQIKIDVRGTPIPYEDGSTIKSSVKSGTGFKVGSIIGSPSGDMYLVLNGLAPPGTHYYNIHSCSTVSDRNLGHWFPTTVNIASGENFKLDKTILQRTPGNLAGESDYCITGANDNNSNGQNFYYAKTGVWVGALSIKDNLPESSKIQIPIYHSDSDDCFVNIVITGMTTLDTPVSRVRKDLYNKLSNNSTINFENNINNKSSKDEVKDNSVQYIINDEKVNLTPNEIVDIIEKGHHHGSKLENDDDLLDYEEYLQYKKAIAASKTKQ